MEYSVWTGSPLTSRWSTSLLIKCGACVAMPEDWRECAQFAARAFFGKTVTAVQRGDSSGKLHSAAFHPPHLQGSSISATNCRALNSSYQCFGDTQKHIDA
jgi:hypothetical protein